MNWKLPFDIPLVTPTMGIPMAFYDALGIIVFVVHIVFIYMLIGASTASVLYNFLGAYKKSPTYDKFAYRLTNITTVSENMGALWGVAPLLVISVLFTGFFYTAILKVSPHILHIIYGNIFAFLLSYAYKFSWHSLEHHKGFHLAIGTSAVLVFFSLPFVFMSMSNLYFQPELFPTVQSIWDVMFTPVTGFRLLNFFLTAFGATGIMMIYFGARWVKAGDKEIGELAISQGKKWFLFSTPLNVAIMPLLLFIFTPRISEALLHTPYIYLPFLASLVLVVLFFLVLRKWNQSVFTTSEALRGIALMIVAISLMATARHGIRVVSFEEPLAAQARATQAYMEASLAEYQNYKTALKNAPAVDLSDPQALAQSKGCLACHAVDVKLVGPSYQEVANANIDKARLMQAMQNGSVGKWDTIEMPAQDLSPSQAELLADWILGMKTAH